MVAGIVLYNPVIKVLLKNIEAIRNQVTDIILVDNASSNRDSIDLLESLGYSIIKNNTNKGVACALNQICEYAKNRGASWVVTLDQDSIVPDNLIKKYTEFCGYPDVAMLCPSIFDRNIGLLQKSISDYVYVDYCITSASAINLQAWENVGGFYEDYFIDSVDFDMCYQLRHFGYKILRVCDLKLSHEVGKSKKVSFLGLNFIVYNHNPLRCYYIIRNKILLAKRTSCHLKFYSQSLKRFFLIAIFEEKRIEKICMMLKGYYHSIIGKYGKYDS